MRVSISRADAAELIVRIEEGLHRLEGLRVIRELTGQEEWLDATHDAVDPIDSVSASLQELFGMTFDEAELLCAAHRLTTREDELRGIDKPAEPRAMGVTAPA